MFDLRIVEKKRRVLRENGDAPLAFQVVSNPSRVQRAPRLARKIPLCRSMASTSVVLPWSTCAIDSDIANLLTHSFLLLMTPIRVKSSKDKIAAVTTSSPEATSPKFSGAVEQLIVSRLATYATSKVGQAFLPVLLL